MLIKYTLMASLMATLTLVTQIYAFWDGFCHLPPLVFLAHYLYLHAFFFSVGNFLVSKAPPHKPILLDFGLTKRISNTMRQALAKMFLSCAEVGEHWSCN